MVKLHEGDIQTREVLDWKGLHLLHFAGSSCSQKTRIFLNLKGIDWISHPVNLARQANISPWFLGINPRGLVPVLVHDGDVHIESNDILEYLDARFPTPTLIPEIHRDELLAGLEEEDRLHIDLRNLTMRFVIPPFIARKKPAALELMRADAGTIEGKADPHKKQELEYWENFSRQGVTDQQALESIQRFRQVYEKWDQRLAQQDFLLGEELSLLDIAWFIYTLRLTGAGYPFARLHPHVESWYRGLLQRDEFAREAKAPLPLWMVNRGLHAVQAIRRTTLARLGDL